MAIIRYVSGTTRLVLMGHRITNIKFRIKYLRLNKIPVSTLIMVFTHIRHNVNPKIGSIQEVQQVNVARACENFLGMTPQVFLTITLIPDTLRGTKGEIKLIHSLD